MIMDLKEVHDKLGPFVEGQEISDDEDDDDCALCEQYEHENDLLRAQTEQQSLVIEKLSKAQELLMMQYKIMELGLNKELASIQQT